MQQDSDTLLLSAIWRLSLHLKCHMEQGLRPSAAETHGSSYSPPCRFDWQLHSIACPRCRGDLWSCLGYEASLQPLPLSPVSLNSRTLHVCACTVKGHSFSLSSHPATLLSVFPLFPLSHFFINSKRLRVEFSPGPEVSKYRERAINKVDSI